MIPRKINTSTLFVSQVTVWDNWSVCGQILPGPTPPTLLGLECLQTYMSCGTMYTRMILNATACGNVWAERCSEAIWDTIRDYFFGMLPGYCSKDKILFMFPFGDVHSSAPHLWASSSRSIISSTCGDRLYKPANKETKSQVMKQSEKTSNVHVTHIISQENFDPPIWA